MGEDTSLRVSKELADELYQRKGRGTSYEDFLWQLLERVDEDDDSEPMEQKAASEDIQGREVEHDRTERQVEETEPEPDVGEVSTPDFSANVGSEVEAAVKSVASSWEDAPDRLTTRKDAAAVVLAHAIQTGEAVGKSSDVVEHVRTTFDVSGQNEDTYWRKNIRPVLKEYGHYSQGKHGYVVEEITDG